MDILCLQEVFPANLQRRIYRALKNKYPYILSALDLTVEEESSERACSVAQVSQVDVCARQHCSGLEGEQYSICFQGRYIMCYGANS